MRIAIYTITSHGAQIAEKISRKINGCRNFIKGRDFDRLSEIVDDTFKKYDALIFITSTGIAVRMIAKHIESKLTDPAVLVIDELGQHVISLLSGHIGGANELTLKVAESINAEAVITTATDINNKLAIDSLALKVGVKPEPKEAIKIINSAILKEEPVYLTAGKTIMKLTPLKLIVGIGCKRGTTKEIISKAVEAALKKIDQPIERIGLIASVDIKRDEAGLKEYAKMIGKEIKFFNVETLQNTIERYNLSESEFVKRKIGVGNVCEAAALSSVERGKIILPKTKYEEVTIAMIWS